MGEGSQPVKEAVSGPDSPHYSVRLTIYVSVNCSKEVYTRTLLDASKMCPTPLWCLRNPH